MFIETLCIENRMVKNQTYHRKRMIETLEMHGYSVPEFPDVVAGIPLEFHSSKIKCTINYDEKINEITYKKYVPRNINSLKIVTADNLDYAFKYSDRKFLESHLQYRGECDEILIVQQGCITDTSYSNVVFEKQGIFYTPDTYLLNGTKRQQLISEGVIKEIPISIENIYDFEKIYLTNAMLDIKDNICFPARNIFL